MYGQLPHARFTQMSIPAIFTCFLFSIGKTDKGIDQREKMKQASSYKDMGDCFPPKGREHEEKKHDRNSYTVGEINESPGTPSS